MTDIDAIGTAYLRVDLLPPTAQPEIRRLHRQYLEARLAAYRALPDREAARSELDRAAALQADIWKASTGAARADGNPGVISLVAASLNEMFDAGKAFYPPSRV